MTHEQVRAIALALPEVRASDGLSFSVRVGSKDKALCWLWNERVEPKRPRVPNPEVLAVRTRGPEAKAEFLAAAPDRFFTEPHYQGYPAVLVRLHVIEPDELRELLTEAWRALAPKRLVRASETAADPDR